MNTRDLFTHYDLGRRVVVHSDPAMRPPDQPVTASAPTMPESRSEQPYDCPQVIVVQGREHPSWLREHAGHLIAAAGIGVLGLAVLAVVAIIAVAVCLAAITSAVAVVAIQAMAASSQPPRRRGRW